MSCDGGSNWQSFQNNLPAVEVRDIRIQPHFDDLVIATHGRAIWVMDDIRPVQQSACGKPTAPWSSVRGPASTEPASRRRRELQRLRRAAAGRRDPGQRRRRRHALLLAAASPPQAPDDRRLRSSRASRGATLRANTTSLPARSATSYWLSNADGKNEFHLRFHDRRARSATIARRSSSAGPRKGRRFHRAVTSWRFISTARRIASRCSSRRSAIEHVCRRSTERSSTQQRRVYDLLGAHRREAEHAAFGARHARRRQEVAQGRRHGDRGQASVGDRWHRRARCDADVVAAKLRRLHSEAGAAARRRSAARWTPTARPSEPDALCAARARLRRRAKAYDAWVASLSSVNTTLKAAGQKPVSADTPH